MLCDGERVAGFVDCDHFSMGPRVLDVAYYLTSMVVHWIAIRRKREQWLEMFPCVLRGYESVSRLSVQEREAVFPMLIGVLLMFAGHFCGTGDLKAARKQLSTMQWFRQEGAAIVPRCTGGADLSQMRLSDS